MVVLVIDVSLVGGPGGHGAPALRSGVPGWTRRFQVVFPRASNRVPWCAVAGALVGRVPVWLSRFR